MLYTYFIKKCYNLYKNIIFQAFPDQPSPNSVFVSNNPPPYPGVMGVTYPPGAGFSGSTGPSPTGANGYPGNMPPGYPGNVPPGYPGNAPPGYPGNAPPGYPGGFASAPGMSSSGKILLYY